MTTNNDNNDNKTQGPRKLGQASPNPTKLQKNFPGWWSLTKRCGAHILRLDEAIPNFSGSLPCRVPTRCAQTHLRSASAWNRRAWVAPDKATRSSKPNRAFRALQVARIPPHLGCPNHKGAAEVHVSVSSSVRDWLLVAMYIVIPLPWLYNQELLLLNKRVCSSIFKYTED